MYNNILISVVVFNKSIADIPIIFELLSSDINVELIIYDNSTDPIIAESNNLNHKHLMYYHDENNSGVSQAYNHSFEYALSSNKSAVLILDQDTYFLLSNLDDYINAFNEYGDTFIYAPIVCDKNKSKIYSPATLKTLLVIVVIIKSLIYRNFKILMEYLLSIVVCSFQLLFLKK
ncbi:glycosyltransferase [Aliivibrio salmonicida]|uniref:glycosyltransferase n=1 Tax=Aliivibrio salmonicida TaxID=40269 RepID=UPI0013EE09EA|nr:glycosyltransferase [Aliivibrio salmonicida]